LQLDWLLGRIGKIRRGHDPIISTETICARRKVQAGVLLERLVKTCPELFEHWRIGMIGAFV